MLSFDFFDKCCCCSTFGILDESIFQKASLLEIIIDNHDQQANIIAFGSSNSTKSDNISIVKLSSMAISIAIKTLRWILQSSYSTFTYLNLQSWLVWGSGFVWIGTTLKFYSSDILILYHTLESYHFSCYFKILPCKFLLTQKGIGKETADGWFVVFFYRKDKKNIVATSGYPSCTL